MKKNDISVTLTSAKKEKPADESKLGFGVQNTDHMFLMNYNKEKGWHDPRIVPFGPISIMPTASVFHYGQEIFEGLKAYHGADGNALLFRPDENFKRLNESATRLCMPTVDVDFCLDALEMLIDLERDWIPTAPGASLYIRPVMIATEPVLKVSASSQYIFMILLSPSGPYYSSGLAPVSIYVESKYVRAVRGGIGTAKTGGNYASSLLAQTEATKYGCSQVLWLDGVEGKYIEEVGAMNIFFVVDDVIMTPELNGSILSGITRKSVIELLKSQGKNVKECKIGIDEIAKAYDEGRLKECFGAGTAAVVSPVGELKWGDKTMVIGDNKIGAITQKLYDDLTSIQVGKTPSPQGWSVVVKKS